ncbi:FumA C-terminus/TtdB family hydratase beta subunit [Desulfobacula toluolica]|uniref:Fumarate hydratase class I n=1 Tax=Desulfobacula toluolica (strain DSM 7467 / Tol2) TaxID=651182 RepID=K0ND45_DESTT|nr:FumA C-terminus/TtdB family hydratase beta subunit [Desulfobacula toluolica]CCK78680.1 FumB: fumarate hydratase class I (fumarase) [Desulfobacula toluolica Tol2]
MNGFIYEHMFPLGKDTTQYRRLTGKYIKIKKFEEKDVLIVEPQALTLLAEKAFKDVAHLYRSEHLERLRQIIDDPESSDNDRYVALELLKNAVIAAGKVYPMCQDTGTAIVMAKKGQQVWSRTDDAEELSKGVFKVYTQNYLRYSQNAPFSMYDEKNTKTNLPAQIDITAEQGDEYKFLFMAKGGGSANKTVLFQMTKTVLKSENTLIDFMLEKMKELGTSACPPYYIAFVIGGTSVELNLKTVKLASARYLDSLPTQGSDTAHAFRDIDLEKKVLARSYGLGIGTQFGGKYFALDIRVIRLPRHGASCPIGLGVSCSADRQIKGKITKDGIFLEQLEENPDQYLPKKEPDMKEAVHINLNRPMDEIRSELSRYPVATRLALTGQIVVARDIAHAKFMEQYEAGKGLPNYLKNHIVYYAGPAKRPKQEISGSFGPTTAGRMDSYVPSFQKEGASMIMLAKGNRSKQVKDSCRIHGGFYLGSIGGPAARIGKDFIKKAHIIEYEELGMEAVYMITVENFPAFIIIDDKGNDFYEDIL